MRQSNYLGSTYLVLGVDSPADASDGPICDPSLSSDEVRLSSADVRPKRLMRRSERVRLGKPVRTFVRRAEYSALGVAVSAVCLAGPASAASSQVTPTTTTIPMVVPVNANPGLKLTGSGAALFVGAVVAALVVLLFVPIVASAIVQPGRRERFVRRLKNPAWWQRGMVPSTADVVALLEAYAKLPEECDEDDKPGGGRSLTTSLLALATLSLVGLALALVMVSSSSDASDLRKTIITALLSILASISGFYFGARTAQTSAKQAQSPTPPSRPKSIDQPKGPSGQPDETAKQPLVEAGDIAPEDRPADDAVDVANLVPAPPPGN